ncbi:TetR/AcrR family transcriptional regulator [Streptomyces flaveolus]|uniref:TetR/AcrR family transcriptional regulator n=1 Tax=Streptomyces flaveolus TaxID=67297 RepID=UPI0033DB09CE
MSSSYHSPGRAQAARARREAIVETALALFLERGYENVTVAEIAQAAFVAVSTVYTSTGGKAAILGALIEPFQCGHRSGDDLGARNGQGSRAVG